MGFIRFQDQKNMSFIPMELVKLAAVEKAKERLDEIRYHQSLKNKWEDTEMIVLVAGILLTLAIILIAARKFRQSQTRLFQPRVSFTNRTKADQSGSASIGVDLEIKQGLTGISTNLANLDARLDEMAKVERHRVV